MYYVADLTDKTVIYKSYDLNNIFNAWEIINAEYNSHDVRVLNESWYNFLCEEHYQFLYIDFQAIHILI